MNKEDLDQIRQIVKEEIRTIVDRVCIGLLILAGLFLIADAVFK